MGLSWFFHHVSINAGRALMLPKILSVEDVIKAEALAFRLAEVLAAAELGPEVELYALAQIAGAILGPGTPSRERKLFWDLVLSLGIGDSARA
jgi:hypothetical protein